MEVESTPTRKRNWFRTYYSPGLEKTADVDLDGDGEVDRYFQYVVDAECLTTEALVADNPQGFLSGDVQYEYDDRDNLINQVFDYDGDDEFELRVELQYNDVDNPILGNVYVNNSDEIFAQVTYTYDADDRLIREETNDPYDENINEVVVYDDEEAKMSEEIDEDEDGVPDLFIEYDHDESGNLLSGVRTGPNDTLRGEITFKYDCLAGWERPPRPDE